MSEMNFTVISMPLKNPPLREMTFGVALETPSLPEQKMSELMKNADPDMQRAGLLQAGDFRFNPVAGGVENVGQPRFSGLRFHKGKNLFVTLQNSPDGQHVNFSYSILPPYTSWDDFTELALSCYRRFQSLIPVKSLRRIAVRTIDELGVPKDTKPGDIPFSQLLKTVPADIQGLGGGAINDFFLRDLIYYPQCRVYATTVRSLKPKIPGQFPRLILDSDVYSLEPLKADDESAFVDVLQRIRYVRHKIFFGSIGDKCLEACNE